MVNESTVHHHESNICVKKGSIVYNIQYSILRVSHKEKTNKQTNRSYRVKTSITIGQLLLVQEQEALPPSVVVVVVVTRVLTLACLEGEGEFLLEEVEDRVPEWAEVQWVTH